MSNHAFPPSNTFWPPPLFLLTSYSNLQRMLTLCLYGFFSSMILMHALVKVFKAAALAALY